MEYRRLCEKEISADILASFVRTQKVDLCRRKIDGEWKTVSDPFTDDWTDADRIDRAAKIRQTAASGGAVFGAFDGTRLVGFVSIEGERIGSRDQYIDLSRLHVSQDMRHHGIGKRLFALAADEARSRGGEKLYISAHSAIESQAFYAAMGCIEATEYSEAHVLDEPCDCQLEFVL